MCISRDRWFSTFGISRLSFKPRTTCKNSRNSDIRGLSAHPFYGLFLKKVEAHGAFKSSKSLTYPLQAREPYSRSLCGMSHDS